MFQGIDPQGLTGLADVVTQTTNPVHLRVTESLQLLTRHGRLADANQFGSALNAIGRWGLETGSNLKWRAEVIARDQQAGFDFAALLRAHFAAQVAFSGSNADSAFADWVTSIAVRKERVDAAVANISSWLSQSLTDWDVTNGDLHNIRRTLDGLTGDELDQVIARLSPAQLERWIAEMSHRINGFSRDEKRYLLAMVATNTSGETLGRIHDAILATGGQEEAADLGAAIQAHSTDKVIADFVAYAVARDLAGHRFSSLAPALAIGGLAHEESINVVARIVAGSETALAVLVVDSHLGTGTDARSAISTLSGATDIASRSALFAAMAAAGSDRDHLARLVVSRRSPDQSTREPVAEDRVLIAEIEADFLSAATSIIKSDPNGVIQELATNLDRDGSLTRAFWGMLTADEQGGTIAGILTALRGGDEVQADEFARIGPDPTYTFPHARNLAFTAATLNLAFASDAEEAKGDIDKVARLAGVIIAATGILSRVGEVGGGLIGMSEDWGISAASAETKGGIDQELAKLIDVVTERLRPTEPAAELSGGASAAWTDVYLELMPFA